MVIIQLILLLLACPWSQSLSNGVGRTPAMGWNSWNFFRCNINETLIKEVADALVANGLRDAGYKYVNIDDCWMEKRGADGEIQPFKNKFPNGMKAVADYVHSKGLKFGVYSDTGNHTCEGYPGSWGYEKQDAQTYAKWGVDYLKYDYCGMEKTTVSVRTSYETMRDALNATGRPILFSLCSWGSGQPHLWGQEVGNSWRTGIDLFAVWDAEQAKRLKLPSFLQPVSTAIKQQEQYAEFAGPGGFNDPDMLVVGLEGMYPYGIVQECPEHIPGCKPGEYISRDRWGRVGGLSVTEQRTHFAFWCMLAAPLILGNDPRHMTTSTLDILLAPEILALSQDVLGKQARKMWADDTAEIWTKPLSDNRIAVMAFNSGEMTRDIELLFSRDLSTESKNWERDVPPPGGDACKDKDRGCPGWAQAGECKNNAGFMLATCPFSCPEGCPFSTLPAGSQATAVVRDAWQREDLGAFTSRWLAHLVEPHAARVVTLKFVEPADAAAADARVKQDQEQGKQGSRSHERGAPALKTKEVIKEGDALQVKAASQNQSALLMSLKDELQVSRVELIAKSSAIAALKAKLKQQKTANDEAQQRLITDNRALLQQLKDLTAAEEQQKKDAERAPDKVETPDVLSTNLGRMLLASNVVMALTLLMVLRVSGNSLKHVKRGEYTE
ncbi:hypothetical protein CEUSTIGMA_g9841.t1 [Chlamydomonas eustigma]|uniref:Alpha-galactosidase n=1 Tax=Chlamydomonas eustigma TaxID=1157962 RepID=A0A250XH90_9CHLO|nr:hypothetical protein CEUSTIGMA_g9841.t1 [Chlamydomonas eustigma]|eukprot:GAX82413.1 hypothetical protein CEUSTIGMA_g9841.t1 [Chlamydomonas eustigma]